METREETFRNMALKYKKEYDNTAKWKIFKRLDLKKSWNAAIKCVIRERWADEGQISIFRNDFFVKR